MNNTILSKMKGKELEGLTYKPLFPYFEHLKKPGGAFRVLTDGYVTEGAGTGIVHQVSYLCPKYLADLYVILGSLPW